MCYFSLEAKSLTSGDRPAKDYLKVTSAVCADALFTRTCTSDLCDCTRARALSSAGLSGNENTLLRQKENRQKRGKRKSTFRAEVSWKLSRLKLVNVYAAAKQMRITGSEEIPVICEYEKFLLQLQFLQHFGTF